MVKTQVNDGYRIAELLASEITGHEGILAPLSVGDADPDVTPTEDGALTYHILHAANDDDVAAVYAHPKHIRVVIETATAAAPAAKAVADTDIRLCSDSPVQSSERPAMIITSGAEIKRFLPVLESLATAIIAENTDNTD